MIESSIYRAAFLPAALALLVVLFSFQQQPPSLAQPQPGDVLFDQEQAIAQAREIARLAPDRRVGTQGDDATAALVRRAFASRRFGTQVDKWTDDDGTRMTNVIGGRPGASRRQVVVIAARDAHRVPDLGGSAADTAALLELARILEGRAPRKTVILLSADGSSYGSAGVRRWLDRQAQPDLIDGVVVIDQLGATRSSGPLVVDTSNSHRRANAGLVRTARRSVGAELGSPSMEAGLLRQFPRVAVPIGVGGQGSLIAAGVPAVRISGSGELDPTADGLNEERYDRLGRSMVRMYSAMDDGGKPEPGPNSYLTTGTKLMPGWAIAVLALALLLPPVVAGIDAMARARRQKEYVLAWFGWIGAGALALVAGWGLAEATVLVGLVDDPPPAPLQPATVSIDGSGWAALGLSALTAVGFWFLLRRWVAVELGLMERPGPGSGVAISLTLALLGLAAWVMNPFAALALVPLIHLWMLAALTNVRRAGAIALLLAGLMSPVLIAVFYMLQFDLGPINGLWYAFLLVTGHQVGILATLLGLTLAAVFVSTAILVLVRPQINPRSGQPLGRGSEPRQSITGPGGPLLRR